MRKKPFIMIIIVSVCSCIFLRQMYIVACIEIVSIYLNVPVFVVSITFLFAFACVFPTRTHTHTHTIDYAMDECFCRFFNLFLVPFSAEAFWPFFIHSSASASLNSAKFSLQPFWSVSQQNSTVAHRFSVFRCHPQRRTWMVIFHLVFVLFTNRIEWMLRVCECTFMYMYFPSKRYEQKMENKVPAN